METAINLCLLSCKSFPTVADIRQAIDELRRESKTEPVLQKLPSRSRWTSPAAQAAFTTVKSNKANEHMQGLEITDLLKFAKGIFSEISESTVRKYLPEFMLAQESADMCNRCMWDKKQCVNNGFKATLRISKFGIVDNVMIPCAKNRAV
jgi:superfamily II helicase